MSQARRKNAPSHKRRGLHILIAGAVALVLGGGAIYANAATRGARDTAGREDSATDTAVNTLAAPQSKPTPKRSCDETPTLKAGPACGAWWGVYVPPENGLLRAVTSLENKLERRLDIVFTYHDMSETENGAMIRDEEPDVGRKRILLLGWESERWDTGDNVPWRTIAAGDVDDTIIDPQARRIKKYGKPVLVGFDGEMELRENSGTPAEYVAAYRHIVKRFKKLGVTNVAWVWGVTGYMDYRNRWKAFYPGDSYVDWVSYDPYNFASCRDADWQDFEETVKPTHDWFVRNGFGDKPFIISEYGTESHPDRSRARGQWYKDVPDVLEKLPNIKAVLQWNAIDDKDCDFTLTGPGVLSNFVKAGKDPYVNQSLPKKVA